MPADFEPLFAVYPEVVRWVGDGRPITREQCAEWLAVTGSNYEKYGYGMFALEDRNSAQVVGFCGLVHPGGQAEPEIKYAFRRSHWGRGLAGEAVPALLDYGAAVHSLKYVIATVAEGNLASQRVLLKSGLSPACERAEEDGSVTLVFHWHGAAASPSLLSLGSAQAGTLL